MSTTDTKRTAGKVVVAPWSDHGENHYSLLAQGGDYICHMTRPEDERKPNAERLAAAWNACDEIGATTEALEAGVLLEMVDIMETFSGLPVCKTDSHAAETLDIYREVARNARTILTILTMLGMKEEPGE